MNIVHTYSLKDTSGVLLKDGFDTICPFAPKMPMQKPATIATATGQPSFELMLFPCTIGCPMCNIYESEDNTREISISCGGSVERFKLSDVAPDVPEDKLPKSKLIKM